MNIMPSIFKVGKGHFLRTLRFSRIILSQRQAHTRPWDTQRRLLFAQVHILKRGKQVIVYDAGKISFGPWGILGSFRVGCTEISFGYAGKSFHIRRHAIEIQPENERGRENSKDWPVPKRNGVR